MKVESIAKQQASGFFHDYRVRPHLEMKRANIVRLGTIKMKRVCRIALDLFQDSINMNRVVSLLQLSSRVMGVFIQKVLGSS